MIHLQKRQLTTLKRTNKGRVTFFPMNLIKPKSIDSETMNTNHLEGYIGVASDLVNYDESYKYIIKNKLGNSKL